MHDKMRVPYADPFNPTLRTSESLPVSIEQSNLIRQVLDYSSSDTLFAKKAYDAIHKILTEGSVLLPVIESLSPAEATIGGEIFDIHVVGTGFDQDAKIFFNNIEEPTTRVSETELTTGINMPLWVEPTAVPVHVQNGSGLISNGMTFTFNPAEPITNEFSEKAKEQIRESNEVARELHKNAVGTFDNNLKDRSFISPPSKNDPYKKDPEKRMDDEKRREEEAKLLDKPVGTFSGGIRSGKHMESTRVTESFDPSAPKTDKKNELFESIQESHKSEENKTRELIDRLKKENEKK